MCSSRSNDSASWSYQSSYSLVGIERVVGVESPARDGRWPAEHEVGLAGREDDLALALPHGIEGELFAVERARVIDILDFEGEPA